MHLDNGKIPEDYLRYTHKKLCWIIGGIVTLFLLLIISISVGAVSIPPIEVIMTLLGQNPGTKADSIIWHARLPQALTAIVAGAGLSVAGVAMQSILRNPLASPFTLGISNAGAFGAAFAIIFLGTGTMTSTTAGAVIINNPYLTTISAFFFCMLATIAIIAIAKIKASSPEVVILSGVALSSLFTAGVMFLQYFSDDSQLAAVVHWTFGDVGRAGWPEFWLMSFVTFAACIYFILNRWNYNAMDAGDETAKGLGVNVDKLRNAGMIAAALVTAIIVSFLGVIGFVGLVCPHMVRRIIGDEQRYLIPGSIVMGSLLLLASDTVARLIMAPYVLPVAILTSFLGAPVFIYLLIKGYHR